MAESGRFRERAEGSTALVPGGLRPLSPFGGAIPITRLALAASSRGTVRTRGFAPGTPAGGAGAPRPAGDEWGLARAPDRGDTGGYPPGSPDRHAGHSRGLSPLEPHPGQGAKPPESQNGRATHIRAASPWKGPVARRGPGRTAGPLPVAFRSGGDRRLRGGPLEALCGAHTKGASPPETPTL